MGTKLRAVSHTCLKEGKKWSIFMATWRTNELEAGSLLGLEPCDPKRAKRKLWKDKSKNRMPVKLSQRSYLPNFWSSSPQLLSLLSHLSLSWCWCRWVLRARVCRLRHLRTHIQGEMIHLINLSCSFPSTQQSFPSSLSHLLSLTSFSPYLCRGGTDRVLP